MDGARYRGRGRETEIEGCRDHGVEADEDGRGRKVKAGKEDEGSGQVAEGRSGGKR